MGFEYASTARGGDFDSLLQAVLARPRLGREDVLEKFQNLKHMHVEMTSYLSVDRKASMRSEAETRAALGMLCPNVEARYIPKCTMLWR